MQNNIYLEKLTKRGITRVSDDVIKFYFENDIIKRSNEGKYFFNVKKLLNHYSPMNSEFKYKFNDVNNVELYIDELHHIQNLLHVLNWLCPVDIEGGLDSQVDPIYNLAKSIGLNIDNEEIKDNFYRYLVDYYTIIVTSIISFLSEKSLVDINSLIWEDSMFSIVSLIKSNRLLRNLSYFRLKFIENVLLESMTSFINYEIRLDKRLSILSRPYKFINNESQFDNIIKSDNFDVTFGTVRYNLNKNHTLPLNSLCADIDSIINSYDIINPLVNLSDVVLFADGINFSKVYSMKHKDMIRTNIVEAIHFKYNNILPIVNDMNSVPFNNKSKEGAFFNENVIESIFDISLPFNIIYNIFDSKYRRNSKKLFMLNLFKVLYSEVFNHFITFDNSLILEDGYFIEYNIFKYMKLFKVEDVIIIEDLKQSLDHIIRGSLLNNSNIKLLIEKLLILKNKIDKIDEKSFLKIIKETFENFKLLRSYANYSSDKILELETRELLNAFIFFTTFDFYKKEKEGKEDSILSVFERTINDPMFSHIRDLFRLYKSKYRTFSLDFTIYDSFKDNTIENKKISDDENVIFLSKPKKYNKYESLVDTFLSDMEFRKRITSVTKDILVKNSCSEVIAFIEIAYQIGLMDVEVKRSLMYKKLKHFMYIENSSNYVEELDIKICTGDVMNLLNDRISKSSLNEEEEVFNKTIFESSIHFSELINLCPISKAVTIPSFYESLNSLIERINKNKCSLRKITKRVSRCLEFGNMTEFLKNVILGFILFDDERAINNLNKLYSNQESMFLISFKSYLIPNKAMFHQIEREVSEHHTIYDNHNVYNILNSTKVDSPSYLSEVYSGRGYSVSSRPRTSDYPEDRITHPGTQNILTFDMLLPIITGSFYKSVNYVINQSSRDRHNHFDIGFDFKNKKMSKKIFKDLIDVVYNMVENNISLSLLDDINRCHNLNVLIGDYCTNVRTTNNLKVIVKKITQEVLDPREYKDFIGVSPDEVLEKRIDIPKKVITNDCGKISYIQFQDHNDIQNIKLGNITNCCQIIGSAAEFCVKEGVINPYAGFITYRNDNGKILAQSYIWLDMFKQNLIIDSVETRYTELSTDLSKALIEFKKSIKYNVIIGVRYSKINQEYLLNYRDSNIEILKDDNNLAQGFEHLVSSDVNKGVDFDKEDTLMNDFSEIITYIKKGFNIDDDVEKQKEIVQKYYNKSLYTYSAPSFSHDYANLITDIYSDATESIIKIINK